MPLGFCWKGNYTTKRNVSIFCLNVRKLFQDECWYWLARCTLDKAQMSKHWNQSTKMYGGMITRQFSLDCWFLLSCEQHSRGDIYLLAVFEVASTPAWVFVFFFLTPAWVRVLCPVSSPLSFCPAFLTFFTESIE